MNLTAFFLALVVTLAYYFYAIRKTRAKQQENPVHRKN